MMYMHYCPRCKRMYMLYGHYLNCLKCTNLILEVEISYMDYVKLDINERAVFKVNCENEYHLNKLSTTSRMNKYLKWYREMQNRKRK